MNNYLSLLDGNHGATPFSAAPQPLTWENLWDRVQGIVDFSAAHAAERDADSAFPQAEFQEMAAAGLLAASLRRELGGLGLGVEAKTTRLLLPLLKRLGHGNLAVGRIYEGHVNALQLIQTFGRPEQVRRFADDALRHHRIFGVWNAEAGDGVKIEKLGSRRFRLTGAKTFCSGAGFVERPFVNGATDQGWQMCVVPMEVVQTRHQPDWWQPTGMRATTSYKVDFTGVEVDETCLIGQPEDYHRQPWLTGGAIRFASVQLGGAEALVNLTQDFLVQQQRTKDPYQTERMGRMVMLIQTGNLWIDAAAERVEAFHHTFGGEPNEPVEPVEVSRLVAFANMVRTAIEQICMEVMQLVERSIGARGLLPPLPMERIIRDLTLYLRQPGFDAVLANVGHQAFQDKERGTAA
jgi:alkylation response protein AidB-like acyl-CoA dehydrogenase